MSTAYATATGTSSTIRPDATGSDGDLMSLVAAGDLDAFSLLYDRYADRVMGVVRRVLRDTSQSEEVTQEVFVEAWKLAPRYAEERGSLASWLLTMARRRAIDRVRSEQAARDRGAKVAVMNLARDVDGVAEHVVLKDEYADVRRAMLSLSEVQREAIEHAYFGGLTYREVSELLEVPLSTIKTRIRDGMRRMHDELSQLGHVALGFAA